jgi:hypothetical protein
MQPTSAQPSAGVAGREVDSNDTRAVLKERIRREMRGQQGTAKVSPETPAGPKKEEQPAPPPEKGLKGFLLRSSSILGLLFILCGALPVILITALAESEDAAGAEITYHCENCRQDSPLSAASRQDFRCGACNNRLKRQINPPSGEGVFVLYLYEVWALLLLIHLSRKDGAVLIYAFLLLAALFLHVQWMMQGQIGGDPLVLDVEESVGPRSLSRFLTHVSTLLWVYCIAVLGQRMMRYPLGAILLGVLIGAQAVELYGAWTHTQTLYSLQGVGFWAGVALFPLIVLESVSRNPAEYGDTREPGLVTRMMTGPSGN